MGTSLEKFGDLDSLDETFITDVQNAIRSLEYHRSQQDPNREPSAEVKEAARKLTGVVRQWKSMPGPDFAGSPRIDLSKEDHRVLGKLHDAVEQKDAEKIMGTVKELEQMWTFDRPDPDAMFRPEEGVDQAPEMDFATLFKAKPPPVDAGIRKYVRPVVPPFPTEAELEEIKTKRAAAERGGKDAEGGEVGSEEEKE